MAFVSFRLENDLLNKVESSIKERHYSTKTEFIREAIRDKLGAIEKEKRVNKQWDKLLAMRGTLEGKGLSEEEYHEFKHKVGEEFIRKKCEEFNLPIPDRMEPLQEEKLQQVQTKKKSACHE